MKSFIKQLAGFISFTLLFSLLLFPQANAMEQGFYLGFGGNYLTKSGGAFHGNSFLYDANEPDVLIDIPKLANETTGFAGRFGIKAIMWALDFQFSQSIFNKIDSGIDQLDGRLFVSFYDLNVKYYLIEQFRAGVYTIFGLGYSTLTGERIKRTGATPADYVYSTTTYAGITANIGVGIDYYLTRQLFLYGEYIYRANGYTVVDDLEINDPLNQPFHSIYFGLAYALPQ